MLDEEEDDDDDDDDNDDDEEASSSFLSLSLFLFFYFLLYPIFIEPYAHLIRSKNKFLQLSFRETEIRKGARK